MTSTSPIKTPVFEQQQLFHTQQRGKWHCQYRVPNLLVSQAGTIFALPQERVNGIADEAKSHLVLRRSFDHGRTWTEIQILYADDHPRVSYSYSGGVADILTGRIFVFVALRVAIGPDDIGGVWPEKWKIEHPQEAADLEKKLAPQVESGTYLIWTDDEGETWSKPQALGEALFVTNPVTGEMRPFGPQFVGTQLQQGAHKGRLVVPGRGFSTGSPFALYAYGHNYVVYSDDHGQTWQPGGLTQNGTGEACLVELRGGVLLVNSRNESLRCRGYRAWDRSIDGGQTFIESGYDLALPEPHCAAAMARMPNGDILFCNPAVHSSTPSHYDHAARHHLTVRVSRDDARSWPVSRVICTEPAGYSALAVTADGHILCAYETLNENSYTGDIMLARFSPDWLTNK